MRTIKFRGYNRKNNIWLYGFYLQNRGQHFVCPDEFATGKSWEDYEIDPETLGQFTGLFDKNGAEIYEGDIVSHPYIDPIFRAIVDESSVKSKVAFHDGAFVINYDVDDFIFLDAFIREGHVEVVGNIHDNPELLTTSK